MVICPKKWQQAAGRVRKSLPMLRRKDELLMTSEKAYHAVHVLQIATGSIIIGMLVAMSFNHAYT